MENENDFQVYRGRLGEKLRLVENLWQRLANNHWDQASFVRFVQHIQEITRLARHQDDKNFADIAERLGRHSANCMVTHSINQEQGQLSSLLNQLRRIYTEREGQSDHDQPAKPRNVPEIFVVGSGFPSPLVARLQKAGFQVRAIPLLEEAEALLQQLIPLGLIITLDFPGRPQAGLNLMGILQTQQRILPPVFIVAEEGGMATRLEAVQAGAVGFFQAQHLDVNNLVDHLAQRLFQRSAPGGFRVVMVDDSSEAHPRQRALEGQGITVDTVSDPLLTLDALSRSKPDMLILNLDVSALSGIEVYRVVRQHQQWENLPLLLLSNQTDLKARLPRLENDYDDLLPTPCPEDYLGWYILRRLRQARSIRARLSALTIRDTITGLYNRRYFLAQLERAMVRSKGKSSPGVMLAMVTNMRTLREKLNPRDMDSLIQAAARRLQKKLGNNRPLARFSDAMFAYFEDATDQARFVSSAEELLRLLTATPYKINDQSLTLRVAVGLAVVKGDERDHLDLIQRADLSCTLARDSSEAQGVHLFDAQQDREIGAPVQRQRQSEVQEAVDNERFSLLFQPIVSLHGDSDERYEVLLRMHDANGEELLLRDVLDLVQKSRLGLELDRRILERCLRILKKRSTQENQTTLFINITTASLLDPQLVEWLRQHLAEAGVDGAQLIFEIEEATVRRYLNDARNFMEQLGQLGCQFSLQRFGNRQESLDLIRDLPVHYVKPYIDFIHDLSGSTAKQNQLRSLVDVLTISQVIVIASGVEDLSTLPVLWSCGVHFAQGYFLQRPHEDMSFDFSGGAF